MVKTEEISVVRSLPVRNEAEVPSVEGDPDASVSAANLGGGPVGFDELVVSLHARGLTVYQIQAQLRHRGIEASLEFIGRVTGAVEEDVDGWSDRTLADVWPVVYIDSVPIRISDEHGSITQRWVYLALGVKVDGVKEVLGAWLHDGRDPEFWVQVMKDLSLRGVDDFMVACFDDETGFGKAIEQTFPRTSTRTGMAHMIRASLRQVAQRDRRSVARALRLVYSADSVGQARRAFERFDNLWRDAYAGVVEYWRANWKHVVAFLSFPDDVRRVLYRTSAIETVSASVQRVVKAMGSFPDEAAALKSVYLAARAAERNRSRPMYGWQAALEQLACRFERKMAA